MLQKVEDDANRLVVRDLEGGLDLEAFDVLGDADLADAFGDRGAGGLELACGVVAEESRSHRVGDADRDVLAALLQRDSHARQGSSGADGADEAVDLAAGLLPDFGARRLDM